MDIDPAASHWALADKYFKAQRFREALDQFREYLWFKPNDPAAHRNGGVAHCDLGEFSLAVEPFLRAVRLGGENIEVYHRLGFVYGELERHEDAARAFQNAIRLDPGSADSYCGLALSFMRLEKRVESMQAANEA